LSSAETEAEAGEAQAAPSDELRQRLIDVLRAELGDGLADQHLDHGRDLWVRSSSEAWRTAGQVARDRLGLTYFCYLSVIDWLPSPFGRSMDSEVDKALTGAEAKEPEPLVTGYAGGSTRFQMISRLYSVTDKVGVTIKADVPDETGAIDSWTPLFGGANWHEREAWEMYGIVFTGHPNLRNLYLPGDFEGHPLRKDFPLLARVVKPWPGIVDVEGMPGVADEEEGGE
jgi:NADH-quinone oxidoreductase subunit C